MQSLGVHDTTGASITMDAFEPYGTVVPTLGGQPIDELSPEMAADALAVISWKRTDESETERDVISKRNSYRNLQRPDMSHLDWVQASISNKEEAIIGKVRSFHASRRRVDQLGTLHEEPEGSHHRTHFQQTQSIEREPTIREEPGESTVAADGGNASVTRQQVTPTPHTKQLKLQTSAEPSEYVVHNVIVDGLGRPHEDHVTEGTGPGLGGSVIVKTEYSRKYDYPEDSNNNHTHAENTAAPSAKTSRDLEESGVSGVLAEVANILQQTVVRGDDQPVSDDHLSPAHHHLPVHGIVSPPASTTLWAPANSIDFAAQPGSPR